MISDKWIFDIGMNNGDDTAYYLHLGYRVVAVEADPDLASAGAKRFAREIAEGRLVIVNKAIASEPGEADFWLCDQLSVWNSFDREIATRNGCTARCVRVQTVPLRDLFAEFGVPHYLKVDIEGHDAVAVGDIDPDHAPAYVSMEIGSVEDFTLLRSKGYTRFKCVQQGYFREVRSPGLSLRAALSAGLVRLKSTPLACRLREQYRKLRTPRHLPASQNGWTFDAGASGPFGEEAPGEWVSLEEALHAWLSQKIGHKLGYRVSDIEFQEWFDVHASR